MTAIGRTTKAWHEANRRGWDAVSPFWQERVDQKGDWKRAHREPELVFGPEELSYFPEVRDCPVCVLGSGDNLAVFALAGMGAEVTSVDISQVQLDMAGQRADELGLHVRFLRGDVTELPQILDETFVFIYTGGHVAVWVSNLEAYYREAFRILRIGGCFILNEYHPFRRIWAEDDQHLIQEFSYFDRGPHQYDRSDEVAGAPPGSLPSYEFHWTVSDYIMAVKHGGFRLVAIEEVGVDRQAWECAPMQGLPEQLIIVGDKKKTISDRT